MIDVICPIPFTAPLLTNEEFENWIYSNADFYDERKKKRYEINVHSESCALTYKVVVATNELEAIILACEDHSDEERIEQLLNNFGSRYNDLTDYNETYPYI